MSSGIDRTATLERFIQHFESLTRGSLDQVIQCYAADTRFKDPFNDVSGQAKVRAIFEDMFDQLHEPAFTIVSVIEQPPRSGADDSHEVFLTWDFKFRFRRFRTQVNQCVRGASHIHFDQNGLVTEHRDYWDAAGELYEKVPLLGSLMRWLARRLSVPQ